MPRPRTTYKEAVRKLLMVLVAVVFALAIFEVILRVFFPKYQYAAESNYRGDQMRIWANQANVRMRRTHPDTGREHPVIYNNLALRQHRQIDTDRIKTSVTLAFFGDSFTENLGLPVQYSFTEVLDYLLNAGGTKFTVLNYGVNGYGTGQSYITYSQTHHKTDFDYVFYVFTGNDLRNIYENGLFEIDANKNLARRPPPGTPFWLRVIRRFYTTYLLLEVRAILKYTFDQNSPDINTKVDVEHEMTKWHNRFWGAALWADQQSRWETREGKAIEGSILTGQFDTQAVHIIEIFDAIIRNWQKDVKDSGGSFYVVLLPRLGEHRARNLFASDVRIIDLYETAAGEDEPLAEFVHDGHWNEYGNMLAAMQIYSDLSNALGLAKIGDGELTQLLHKYYASFGDDWKSPFPLEPSKYERNELDRIKDTYLELE